MKFVAPKKGLTTNSFSPLSFVAVFWCGIRDKHPGSATLTSFLDDLANNLVCWYCEGGQPQPRRDSAGAQQSPTRGEQEPPSGNYIPLNTLLHEKRRYLKGLGEICWKLFWWWFLELPRFLHLPMWLNENSGKKFSPAFLENISSLWCYNEYEKYDYPTFYVIRVKKGHGGREMCDKLRWRQKKSGY